MDGRTTTATDDRMTATDESTALAGTLTNVVGASMAVAGGNGLTEVTAAGCSTAETGNRTTDKDTTNQKRSTETKSAKKKKKKKKHLPAKSVVLDNLRYMAEVVLDEERITDRNGENDCCKIGRMLTGSDNRYWDINEYLFPTFKVDFRGVNIAFPDSLVHSGPIFNYNGGSWTTTLQMPNLDTRRRRWMNRYKQ